MNTHQTDIDPATEPDKESIEGLDDTKSSWGDYPIDDVMVRNEHRTIRDVVHRIKKGGFTMDPAFQRDFIWDEDKQSKLIESVVMRIPLPVFYFAEDNDGNMVVVDGLQRLTTFERFLDNELRLRLPDRPELHKLKFQDLPPKLKNRIEDCNLILYSIDPGVPERARLDIFERVNSGVALSRQQMRNCLYMGKATKFLKDEARTEYFLDATGGSLKTLTMRDREFVNRFCAFQILDRNDYDNMDQFLAEGLKKMNSESEKSVEWITELSSQFRTSLHNNFLLFGKYAFRKHEESDKEQGNRRSVLNASLWDVMSTGFSRYSTSLVEEHSETLKAHFYRLVADPDFIDAITHSPNDSRQVKRRFSMAEAMFKEVFDAH